MATLFTQFNIGQTVYTYDPDADSIMRGNVSAISVNATGTYYTVAFRRGTLPRLMAADDLHGYASDAWPPEAAPAAS